MQVTWSFLLKLLSIAVGIALLGNALFLLAVFPGLRTAWVLLLAGLVISAASVPRQHWIRALVGGSCFAAILVSGTVFR